MLHVETYGPVTRIRLARTLFGRDLFEVSAYSLEGGLLIDSGCPATAPELARACQELELHWVVHTHHHEDHVGGSPLLQRQRGVEIFAPRETVERMARAARIPRYREVVWGQPEPCLATPILEDEIALGGYRFRLIPTPGHAYDHHALFEPDRGWLFSGDLYIHERVMALRRIERLWPHVESLRKIRALRPERMFCAHRGPVADPIEAIDRKIRFWEKMADQARELADRGRTARQIRRELVGREGMASLFSLGDFSRLNFVRQLLSRPEGSTSSRTPLE